MNEIIIYKKDLKNFMKNKFNNLPNNNDCFLVIIDEKTGKCEYHGNYIKDDIDNIIKHI